MIPETYEFALLVLIAGSLWKLVADDEILDRPRNWLIDWLDDNEKGWVPGTETRGTKWELFITCPWCAGFWLSGIVYVAWLATLGDPEVSASAVVIGLGVWFAIRALVGVYGLVVKVLQAASA